MVTEKTVASGHEAVLLPRNPSQVRNQQRLQRQQARLTHDDIYNLHELFYEIPNLIWKLEILPDMVCIVGQKQMFEECTNALDLKSATAKHLLSYDTTFDLGDYYVSVLSFRHILFESSPVVPAAFLIHERKYLSAHQSFFETLAKEMPLLKKISIPIVTDREVNMTKAIKAVLPNLKILYCWNHIRRDAKFWLRNHGATSQEITVYMSDLSDILACVTDKDLQDTVTERKQKWSQSWVDYFTDHIQKDIFEHCSKKVLLEVGMYSPYTGITNNQAESVNAMVKRIHEWKELPVDGMVLSINFLQTYLLAECMRGRCDLGSLAVRDEFAITKLDPEDVEFPKSIVNPDNLLEKVKDTISEQHVIATAAVDCTKLTNEKEQEPARFKSQTVLAKDAVINKRVHHCPETGAFIVDGTSNKYAVTLFPKETCQCPSTITCTHILAARLSIGLSIEREKTKVNLTRLRRNARKRRDKKSGKKQPRPNDYEVVAAPDSFLSETSIDLSFVDIDTSTPAKSRKRIYFNNSDEEKTPTKSILKKRKRPCEQETLAERVEKEFTRDDLALLMGRLRGIQLEIPQSFGEFVSAASEGNFVFSFYREALKEFEKDMEALGPTLADLPNTDEQQVSERSKLLQLTAAVLCRGLSHGITPITDLLETFKPLPGNTLPVPVVKRSLRRGSKHVRIGNNDMNAEDFSSLKGDNWVNDKAIHAYLGLRMQEVNEQNNGIRVTVLPSFLHLLWERDDFKSWLFLKIPLSSRKILMPLNWRNQHWSLLTADTTTKEVSVFDSLDERSDAQRAISHWIKFMDMRGEMIEEELKEGWTEKTIEHSRQTDSNSCGVFVLMNADAVLKKLPLIVMRQCHVAGYRKFVHDRLMSTAVPNNEKVCEIAFCEMEKQNKDCKWIQCEACCRWFHWQCIGLGVEPKNYICLACI